MTTQSTEEAIGLLEEYRRLLIKMGREVGARLAGERGTVTSRDVRAELVRKGLLTDERVGDYWLGAVFRDARFEWTGNWMTYSDEERNIHERTIKVWKLR